MQLFCLVAVLADADKRIGAAKQDVAAADLKVAAADLKVAAAKQEYIDAAALNDEFFIGLAKQRLQSAQHGLESAQTILTAASNVLAVAMGMQHAGMHLPSHCSWWACMCVGIA